MLIVSRTLPGSVYFKTINTRLSTMSTEKCGLGCAPTISRAVCLLSAPFVFSSSWFHLILKHWNSDRILDYVTCVRVIIPFFKW